MLNEKKSELTLVRPNNKASISLSDKGFCPGPLIVEIGAEKGAEVAPSDIFHHTEYYYFYLSFILLIYEKKTFFRLVFVVGYVS